MARIFSIGFDYQHQHYTALVTACSAANSNARYVVMPNDDKLKDLLPNGKISFNSLSDLRPMAEKQPWLNELVLSVASALHQKLEHASS